MATATAPAPPAEGRTCWVCLGNEEDDRKGAEGTVAYGGLDKVRTDEEQAWIHPCRCTGTAQWVHHECLRRWVVGQAPEERRCPRCLADYRCEHPPAPVVVVVGDTLNAALNRACPVLALTCGVAFLYGGMAVYGYHVATVVAGRELTNRLLFASGSRWRTAAALMLLPTIPLQLLIIRLWQVPQGQLRLALDIGDGQDEVVWQEEPDAAHGAGADAIADADAAGPPVTMSFSRLLIGSMLYPYIARAIGSGLLVGSPLEQSVVGGIIYFAVSELAKSAYRRHRDRLLSHLRILNFSEESEA